MVQKRQEKRIRRDGRESGPKETGEKVIQKRKERVRRDRRESGPKETEAKDQKRPKRHFSVYSLQVTRTSSVRNRWVQKVSSHSVA